MGCTSVLPIFNFHAKKGG